jgi:hypothetical protein
MPKNVVWNRNGLPLLSSDKVHISFDPETGECSLTITDTTDEDKGAYRVIATNEHGSTNTSCQVNIKSEKPEIKKEGAEPFFTKSLLDQWISEGDTLTFHCAVSGDPAPEIKWLKNGMPIKPSDRIIIENTPDGECKLTIKDATTNDEGLYRVEAVNKHGTATTQATAHVDLASKIEPIKLDEGEPPKFIIELDNVSVRLGETIELECKVTGKPMPQVKFAKDGNPLRDDMRYEWDNNPAAGTYKLKIRNATLSDEGTWRAIASNPSGSATTKSLVKIDDGSAAGPATTDKAPTISARLSDVRVTEGQPLRLECRIDGSHPLEIVWFKGRLYRP